jgi:hypothetical protein
VSDLLTKMFFGGFVRMHVLYHATKESIFGVEMMEELARHGYDVGAGTLYPLLHQLEEVGYLISHTEVVAGKQRKYYRATTRGSRRAGGDPGEAPRTRLGGPRRPSSPALDQGRWEREEVRGPVPDSRSAMMRRNVTILAASLILVVASTGCDIAAPAAVPEGSAADLQAEVKALRELVPDQAHIMADVGDHFTNLWFAGRAENWPLADFYLGETKSHLRWAVRRIPIRKDSQGRDINLGNILEAFENSQLTQLKQAVDRKDRAGFERVYKESLTVCYSCHKAADKRYLRPQVPAEPETRIINFDPKADWPL